MAELAIIMEIGSETCALPVASLREILDEAYVAPAPMAPASIEGVLNRLGRLYVVFDLGSLIGASLETRAKMILFEHDQFHFGAWVDGVNGVVDLENDRIETDNNVPFQTGAVRFKGRIVPYLNADSLFRSVDQLI